MNSEVQRLLEQEDGQIVKDAIREYAKVDIGELAGEFEKAHTVGYHRAGNRILLQIIGVMTRTLVHLVKQNALMQSDYKRGRS